MPSVFAPEEWFPGRQAARELCRDLGPVRVAGLPGRELAMELGDAIERRVAQIHGHANSDDARSPAIDRILGPRRTSPFGRQVTALVALYREAAAREGLIDVKGSWRPMFPAVGYPQQMGDVLIGRTLVEVKCVEVRPAVAVYTGMTQLAWAYLSDRTNTYRLNEVAIYLARHGVFLRWTPKQLLRLLCGRSPTPQELATWRGPSPTAIAARRARLEEVRAQLTRAIERATGDGPGAEFASWTAARAADSLLGMRPEFPTTAALAEGRDEPLDLAHAQAAIAELEAALGP